jgi:hypothetical protein
MAAMANRRESVLFKTPQKAVQLLEQHLTPDDVADVDAVEAQVYLERILRKFLEVNPRSNDTMEAIS